MSHFIHSRFSLESSLTVCQPVPETHQRAVLQLEILLASAGRSTASRPRGRRGRESRASSPFSQGSPSSSRRCQLKFFRRAVIGIQKGPQQFHRIPQSVYVPENDPFSVKFRQAFPGHGPVFFHACIAPVSGIDHHGMVRKSTGFVDQLNPAICLTQINFLADKGIFRMREMGLVHIGVRGIAFQQKHLLFPVPQVVNQGKANLALAHSSLASST